jgi:acetyl esterase/lipase
MTRVLARLRERPVVTGEPVEIWRAGMEERAKSFRPKEGVSFEPVDAGGVAAEWAVPSNAEDRVLVYFHGGGYCCGSVTTHRVLVSFLAVACGARVLNVEYRLAPEHPYPAGIEDAVSAYRWLLSQNVPAARVAIAGDSAGGGLALAAMMRLRDAGDVLPASAVLLCPWTNLTLSGDSIASGAESELIARLPDLVRLKDWYLNGHDPGDPFVSPIFADLSGLPPMLIHVGKADILIDDGRRVAERARAAGVDATLEEWDEMVHVWHSMAPILPEAREAIDTIGGFLRARI